ncbi:MAG: hypothetical protein GXP14_02440 [Gammaproteobacteria bacterium]|nr:hypothetical protein [Gammaproteobacteria bacterium]
MKKSTKAALLSALIFPGMGHFYLKKHIHGAVLSATSFAGVYYLVSAAVEKALQILEKIQSSGIQPNVSEISELISAQSAISGSETGLMNIIPILLLICWVYGIASSYRLGNKQDKKEN